MNPSLQLVYTVNPVMWGAAPTFFLGPNAQQVDLFPLNNQSNDNVTNAVYFYASVLFDIWEYYPPFVTTNSSVFLHYNSLAPGSIFVVTQTSNGDAVEQRYITFDVDNPRAPNTFSGFNAFFGKPDDFPLPDIFAWMFTTWNSLTLFDLGLLADPATDIQQNIFHNETMYENYNSFLIDVIAPYLNLTSAIDNFKPLPLSETNQLQARTISLQTTYLCSQRQLKGWLSIFIAVLAADAALIISAYNLFIFVAGYLQKRRDKLREISL